MALDTLDPREWAETARPWIEWKRLDANVGYLRIRSFAAGNFEESMATGDPGPIRLLASHVSGIAAYEPRTGELRQYGQIG